MFLYRTKRNFYCDFNIFFFDTAGDTDQIGLKTRNLFTCSRDLSCDGLPDKPLGIKLENINFAAAWLNRTQLRMVLSETGDRTNPGLAVFLSTPNENTTSPDCNANV